MTRSTRNLLAGVVALAGGLLGNHARAAAISVFDITQITHAVVDNKTPVYPAGSPDTSNTFSSGYIYNIFGATNNGVEGSGDMLFADGQGANFVDFHTALPVDLTSVALTVGYESDTGNRGYTSWTFQQYTDNTYSTPVVGTTYTYTGLSPAGPVSQTVSINFGQYFQLTMTPSGNDEGVRVYSFTGTGNVVPEPSSIVALCGLGAMGLFITARRHRKAQRRQA